MANAGTVTIDFAAETAKFTAELQKVNRRLKGMEDDFSSFGSVVKKVSGIFGGFVSLGAIASFARQTFAAADAIGDAAARAGVAVDSLSRLKFAAEQSDVEFATLTVGIKEFQKTLSLAGSGASSAQKELAFLGLSAAELRNLKLEDQLAAIADAFVGIVNPADQTRIAVELFGRSGADLVPFLNQGSAGIKELAAEADRLGITMSTTTAAGISAADEALKKLKATVSGFFQRGLGEVALALVGTDDPATILDRQIKALEARRDQANRDASGLGDALTTGDNFQLAADLDQRIALVREQLAKLRAVESASQQSAASAAERRQLLADIEKFNAETQRLIESAAVETQNERDAQNVTNARLDQEIELAQRVREVQRTAEQERIAAKLLENQLVEQLSQEHLDALLQQQVASAQQELQVQSDLSALTQQVRKNLGLQEITFEQIKSATLVDIATLAFTGLAGVSKKFAKIQQGIAAGEVVVATAKNIAKAFPNFGLMAKAAAVGAIQLAKIRAVSFGNASASIGVGGAGDSGIGGVEAVQAQEAVAQGASARAQTNIYIDGFIGRDQMETMIDLLRAETDRDVTLFGASSRQAIDLQPA